MIEARSVYLDNAATTFPKPEAVYRALERFMRENGGSAGRSGHRRAIEAGRLVYGTRERIAGLFNIDDPLRVAFTKNATEALNIAIRGLLAAGDHVVTSSVEHNSVMRPLEAARREGVKYSIARCSVDGSLDPKEVERLLLPETKLVVINHASNVAGTILPLADTAEVAHRGGAMLLVDAAQTAGRLPIDVRALGIDVLTFTGHKELFGPQGTGGIFVREGLSISPLIRGGTGSHSSSLEQPLEMPDCFESGTLNAFGLAGLAEGVEYIAEAGIEAIMGQERLLVERLISGLERLKGVEVHGVSGPEGRVGIVPLTFDWCSPAEAAGVLDRRYGICCRAGMHCSPMAHETMGTKETGVLRVSFSYLNTLDEVDYFVDSLRGMKGAP